MPSEKILEKKKQLVSDLSEKLKKATAGVLVDYRGLNVEQDTNLRRELRGADIEYKVIKNTLIRFALKGTGLDEMETFLENPTALALSYDDVVAPARIITEFAKKNDKLEIKTGFVEGAVMSAAQLIELGSIPSKEVLIARALGGIKSPISSFVMVLDQIAKQKEQEA